MGKCRRILAFSLAVLVLFAMMACLFIVVQNAGHNCVGEHCPVCEITEVCLHTLKVFREALFALLVVYTCVFLSLSAYWLPIVFSRTRTPISQKVKLLN